MFGVALSASVFAFNSHTVYLTATVDSADVVALVSVDNGTAAALPVNFTLSNLTEGGHALQLVAVDAAGNVQVSPWRGTVIVDTLPPSTVMVQPPPSVTNVSAFTFVVAAGGANAAWAVRVELSWTCSRPVRPCDTALAGLPAEWPLLVPSNGTQGDSDSNDGVSVAVTGVPVGVVTATGVGSGVYTVFVRAVDSVTNVDPHGLTAVVTVDLDPPSSVCVPRGWTAGGTIATSTIAVVVAVSDELSLIGAEGAVSVDDGTVGTAGAVGADGRTPVLTVGVNDGTHTLVCTSRDGAGNEQTEDVDAVAVVVDTTAPTLILSTVPPLYTNMSAVQACVRVSDLSNVSVVVSVNGGGRSGVLLATPNDTRVCFPYAEATDGSYAFTATAADVVNNTSPAVQVRRWH